MNPLTIIACGDIHYRHTIPINRRDDYTVQQSSKWFTILDKANEEAKKNDCIVAFPGDIFNEYGQEPYDVVDEFAITLRTANPRIMFVAVAGQHDQRYHIRDLKNTPIKLLSTTMDNFYLLRGKPYEILNTNVVFHGVSYGFPLKDKIQQDDKLHILLIHKMIVKEDALFPGQNAITARNMIRTHSMYDIIISGDNHQSFTDVTSKGVLMNMGSLMRMKTDQKKHKPSFGIIKVDKEGKWTWEVKKIPVLLSKEVFIDESKKKIDEQELGDYRSLVEGLGEDSNINYDYISFLKRKLKKSDAEIREFLNDCIKLIGVRK